MRRRITTIVLTAILLCFAWRAEAQTFNPPQDEAQGFDPRPILSTLISAFQQCGPPQAYQLLSPYLFNLVAQQTSGQGCYAFIRNAGAVTDMEVIDQAMFPVGPLYIVRVTHLTGPVDWFIGFDRLSSKVIYLTFQSVINGLNPSLSVGADQSANLGLVKPPPKPAKLVKKLDNGNAEESNDGKAAEPNDSKAACKKFPQMCP